MTWVIATNVILGYAVGISDIRITFGPPGRRQERDCLQKVYSVGQDLAAGFAGSVEIGFAMINSLRRALKLEDQSLAWDPKQIAEQWPPHARRIFSSYPSAQQELGSQLILIGANPRESTPNTPTMRTCVYSFSWPEFEPVQAGPHEVLSIGSGTDVTPYRKLLERYSHDHKFRNMLLMGESMAGGAATMFGSYVTNVVRDNPIPGVSPHLHLCLVRTGEVQVWPNDHSHRGRWQVHSLGPPAQNPTPDFGDMEKFRMPIVARSFEELCQMIRGDAALGRTSVATVLDASADSPTTNVLPAHSKSIE
ncbi:MAG: hypothetical protein WA672_05965 [Candidatus Angelobacter sp.]